MSNLLHTITYRAGNSTQPLNNNDFHLMDFSRDLTTKMQKMVRQGQIFKLCGIDVSLETNPDDEGGSVSGQFRFFAPTKGRCDAWRHAFGAVQRWRKIQGISPNYNYDFRVGYNLAWDYETWGGDAYNTIANQAWLETESDGAGGATPLGLYLIDTATADSKQSIFDVYNLGIEMNDAAAVPTFGQGWHPYMPIDGTNAEEMDFVKHETALLVTNPNGPQYAQVGQEEIIPFSVSYTPNNVVTEEISTERTLYVPTPGTGYTTQVTNPLGEATNFKWRPISGEYVPVMCGLMVGHYKDVSQTVAGENNCELRINVHLKGWYPIIKRRRKSRRRRGKK